MAAGTERSTLFLDVVEKGVWAYLIVKASVGIVPSFVPYMPAHCFLLKVEKRSRNLIKITTILRLK